MRTFQLLSKPDGWLFAFEIENVYISLAAVVNVLRRIEGVADVEPRRLFSKDSDVHVKFKYRGHACIVLEPFGDNSRYWIGPDSEATFDMAQIEIAFKNYKPPFHRSIVGDVLTFRFARQ